MTLEDFYSKIPFLYHLTSQENANRILDIGQLYSTNSLLEASILPAGEKVANRMSRRPGHLTITMNDGSQVMIRDQRPISIVALSKCLTDGWSCAQFIESLNARVFFWPNLKRLQTHFDRYQDEHPRIIRLETKQLAQLNSESMLISDLNTGATRCHPKWNGAPPPRGPNTFLMLHDVEYSPNRIAEVTFEHQCILPQHMSVAESPAGPWTAVITGQS